jgi:hypothetical protein
MATLLQNRWIESREGFRTFFELFDFFQLCFLANQVEDSARISSHHFAAAIFEKMCCVILAEDIKCSGERRLVGDQGDQNCFYEKNAQNVAQPILGQN